MNFYIINWKLNIFPSGLSHTVVKSFDLGLNCSKKKILFKNKQDKYENCNDFIKMKTIYNFYSSRQYQLSSKL